MAHSCDRQTHTNRPYYNGNNRQHLMLCIAPTGLTRLCLTTNINSVLTLQLFQVREPSGTTHNNNHRFMAITQVNLQQSAPPVKNRRILQLQSFTAHMPLLMATSAFGTTVGEFYMNCMPFSSNQLKALAPQTGKISIGCFQGKGGHLSTFCLNQNIL